MRGQKVQGEISGKRNARESIIAGKVGNKIMAPMCFKGSGSLSLDTETYVVSAVCAYFEREFERPTIKSILDLELKAEILSDVQSTPLEPLKWWKEEWNGAAFPSKEPEESVLLCPEPIREEGSEGSGCRGIIKEILEKSFEEKLTLLDKNIEALSKQKEPNPTLEKLQEQREELLEKVSEFLKEALTLPSVSKSIKKLRNMQEDMRLLLSRKSLRNYL